MSRQPGTRYGASLMTAEQMRTLQGLFDGEAFQQMTTKSPEEIAAMRATGAICAHVLDDVTSHIQPGVTLREVDRIVHQLIVDKYGAEIVRLAVKTAGTGMATTEKISASYGLNDIVANAPATDLTLQPGEVFGIDGSAQRRLVG